MCETRFERLCGAMALLLIVTLAGCSTTNSETQVTQLTHVGPQAHIVLMQPDIKMYVLTAGGVPEPQADWTNAARRNFVMAAKVYSGEHALNLTTMDAQDPPDAELTSYQRLYEVVADSILTYHFGAWALPTKGKTFDWSLGPGVADLGKLYDADYGLFVTYRDYSGSGGRWAYAMVGAVFGVGIPTGGQAGYAALVDMRSGNVVWFNQVTAADVGGGDLRDEKSAKTVVTHILSSLPGG